MDNWRTRLRLRPGPGAVALEVTNRSSLSQADADDIRRGLWTELGALGVHFVGR